jgi:hypothetical protein
MSNEKTLVVILCMHRCGSSLTARLLQRLGMSLGPFELGEVNQWNKYGHFEAQPFVQLNMELQLRQFAFHGDMPDTTEDYCRFLKNDGRWDSQSAMDDATIARGRELVQQLMRSGDVCGFKDPRTVLLWPFWQRVFASLPQLRVVPLFLVRGPHEIAMSLFRRLQGHRDYSQALDVTAVHFHRMKEILDQWTGPTAVVRFDPEVYGPQVRQAVEVCGLPWSDEALAGCYDASCRHNETAAIDHPAQAAYEALAGLPPSRPGADDTRRLLADAATREAVLRQSVASWRQQHDLSQGDNAALRQENAALRQQADLVPRLQAQLANTALDLELIRGSRTWRLRGALVSAFRLSRQDNSRIV